MVNLIKLSDPGWEKTYETHKEAARELWDWVCNQCKEEDRLTKKSSLDDLLCSACGCEFMIEET